ncbi:MAG: tRNA pseudouridine(55) synthase TruB [Nocardioidaceae bacterium]
MPCADGLLVVDKPAGWTSHDVVARGRLVCGTRRVGHAGTLDPMATGVLLLGIGRATRLLGRLALTDKAYEATIRLGQTTVSDDAEGEVIDSVDAGGVTDDAIAGAVASLTGTIQQRPSAVSAIKIDGERAYRRVRAGEDVVLPARAVTVSRFEIEAVRRHAGLVDLDVQVECSTGTYVRALARDLGAMLDVGGHLTRLRRTRVGPYDLSTAHALDALGAEPDVVPLDSAAEQCFPTYRVTPEQATAVRHGRAFAANLGANGQVALFTETGGFLALYEQDGPRAKAVAVFTD